MTPTRYSVSSPDCRGRPRWAREFLTTPERAAQVITNTVLNPAGVTGVYFDEKGDPMLGSTEVRDIAFQDRVFAETRALLREP